MRTATIALSVILLVSCLVHGQGCDKLLSNGVFDTKTDSSSNAGQQSVKAWWCSKNFSSTTEAKKLGLGATVPIDGVPIPFTFSGGDDAFRSAEADYCSDSSVNGSQSQSTSTFIQTASAVITNAFNQCMGMEGLQYGITDMSAAGGDIIVSIVFHSPGTPSVAHVLAVDGGTAISCDAHEILGAEINGSTKYMRCTRDVHGTGTLTISADYGSGLVANFSAVPPPYKVKTGKYDFTFCGAGGCAPAARLVAWGPPPGPTPNGDCTLQDMTAHMPAGGVLLTNQDITLTPTSVRKGSFGHLHPVLLKAINDHTLEFCGSRDGTANDWDKDDMDIEATFRYAVR